MFNSLLLKALKVVVFCSIVISFTVSSYSQFKLSEWESYTSMFDSYTASVDQQGRIWVATVGGVYNLDPQSGVYEEFRNIDALISLDVSTLNCNQENGAVYIGTLDGILEKYTGDKDWTHILDIKNANFSDPRINDIKFKDSLVYIAGGFGITIFRHDEEVFTEFAKRLGEFQPNTNVNEIIFHDGYIWAATEEGLARASFSNSINPKDAWTNYTAANGLPETNVLHLAVNNGVLYFHTEHNLCRLENDSVIVMGQRLFKNVSSQGGSLYYSTDLIIHEFMVGDVDIDHPGTITGHETLEYNGKQLLVVLYDRNGIGIKDENGFTHYKPNTPFANQFNSMDVDAEGNLWSCSDGTTQGLGFSKFSDGDWTNFIPDDFPDHYYDLSSAYKIKSHPDGRLFISTWGHGFIIGHKLDGEYDFDYYSKGTFPIINDFPVFGEADYDRNNMFWAVYYGGNEGGPLLVAVDEENNFHTFPNRAISNDRYFLNMAIDRSGTKFLASNNASGIYYFNEMGSLGDATDDVFGRFTSSNSNLPENELHALEVDNSGSLWIGYATGLARMINPTVIFSGAQPIITTLTTMKNQFVYDIMTDALNYVWVATKEGVWVLDQDAEVIEIITKDNSPLVDNAVLSIASDPKTGRIFFGTKKGLSVVRSLSVEPNLSYDIKCYPQPFRPGLDDELVIDGLATDSEIRILTLDGELVRSFTVMGRTAVWDGKNRYGEYTPSGVYLVHANSTTTEAKTVQKIAIIRK